jgi:hydroxymethylpyrimidine pyrophosphatase-like HAD family hydrolase
MPARCLSSARRDRHGGFIPSPRRSDIEGWRYVQTAASFGISVANRCSRRLREVVDRLRAELPGGSWALERADEFCHEPTYESRWPVPDGTIVGAVDTLIGQPAIKLLLRDNTMSADALLERARSAVGGLVELSHSNSADALLEIAAPGVSKATALAQLCEERGIGREAVIAFGDMPNDLPMLVWAGYAVAVANAHPDVIAAADEVTAANDDAGVARVLERLFSDRRTSRGKEPSPTR